jgi:hypothetical protein
MSLPRKVLIAGSLALAVWAMGYGLYYAVFVEHQTLDNLGGELASGFVNAAQGQIVESKASLDVAAARNYVYVRQVDAHGHWIGLALLLLILGIGFDRVGFGESLQLYLALSLLFGGVLFPLGVFLESLTRGAGPQALAVTGSALLIIGLAGTAWGFARGRAA